MVITTGYVFFDCNEQVSTCYIYKMFDSEVMPAMLKANVDGMAVEVNLPNNN